MKGFIYKITNKVNGKVYIGQTRYTVEFRWRQHIHKKDNTHFHNAIRKYGVDNFIVETLEECDYKDLNSKEIFYIAKYDSFKKGYNSTLGGDGNRILILDDKYDEIKNLYLSGFSSNKIADLYGVDKATIVKILKSLDVKIRSNKLNINKQEFEEIVRDYNTGCSLKSIAKRYDCSGPALKEYLIRKGVDIKNKYSILQDPEGQQALIDDYLSETTTLKEVLSKHHCSYNVFTKILKMHGIQQGKKHFKLSKSQCLDVLEMGKKGLTVREIAKHFGVDVGTIYSIYKRYQYNYLTV